MEAFEVIHATSTAIQEANEYQSTEEAYTRSMVDILEQYNEVEAVTVGHYSMISNGKELWKINAFSVNEEEQDYQLSLFIIKYSDKRNGVETILTNEVNVLKNKIKRFLKNSIEGKVDNIQEHSVVYQLSKDISNKIKKISKVDIYVLTNQKFPSIGRLVQDDEYDNIDLVYHFWDVIRFDKLLSSNKERNSIDIDFVEYTGAPLDAIKINKSEKYSCLLTVFNGEMISNLYRDHDTRLLESNVRVFLQQTGKVNKGIRDTIIEKPEMFLPYNNGISATCENVEFENGQLKKVYDLQIVNGGQTTASLYYTKKKHSKGLNIVDLKKVDVQVKITIIPDKKIKDEEVPKISEYANTQNKVSQLDLKSNHPYLVKIEEYSRKVTLKDPANRNLEHFWFFERVNGSYKEAQSLAGSLKTFKELNPPKFKFIKPDLARWINLFEGHPYEVSKGAQKSFLLLINNHATEHMLSVDKTYYMALIGKGVLFKWFDFVYGRHNTNPVGDTNVKSYTVSYAISLMNHHIGTRLDFIKIAERQEIDESLYDDTRKILKQTYDYLVKESKGGLISELSKKKVTWDSFKHITPVVEFKSLFDKYLLNKSETSAIENDANDYIIKLDSIASKGSVYWDALSMFAKPENSGGSITISDKQLIEKGYNYFFRLKGVLSYSFLDSLILFVAELEKKYDVDEILKLSNRGYDKKLPDLVKVHEKLLTLTKEDLSNILKGRKVQNSKAKEKYISAIKSLNINELNYDEMTLDELRYLGWAIGVK